MIVRALPEHIGDIARIERDRFSPPWSEESLRYELDADYARFLAEAEGGQVRAYGIFHIFGDQAELVNIASDRAFEGRGLCRALLAELIAGAAREGVRDIFLEVRVSNLRAQRLYRAFGFNEAGLRPGYYDEPKEDALIMCLSL